MKQTSSGRITPKTIGVWACSAGGARLIEMGKTDGSLLLVIAKATGGLLSGASKVCGPIPYNSQPQGLQVVGGVCLVEG